MAEKLVVDIDALATAKSELNAECERMKTLKNELSTAVEDLRTKGWISEAGTEFFKKFDDVWIKNMDDYIEVIDYMIANVEYARGEYERVIDAANSITLENGII